MVKRLIENVFVTEGVPAYTFVPPQNFNEILLDVRRPGKPVVIEGQSGTGKTTTVKKVLEQLGRELNIVYWTAREPSHLAEIERVATTRAAGTYVIDDFHRLPASIQVNLADIAKLSAEQIDTAVSIKLVLIGINNVGSDLIQLVPDIAKRTGIHRIRPGTRDEIAKLIGAGCGELNISIANQDLIFNESRGDYWLTQQLCLSICTMNNILETQATTAALDFDLDLLRSRVVDKLKSAYYPAVKEFCRGRRFRPSNDPYYKVLRLVGQQDTSVVDLNELANSNPDVRGSINNIKERRLSGLLQDKAICARYFYYNPETKNFAIEDPALFYFLKHLNWNGLRSDCGFRDGIKDYDYDIALSFAGENRELAKHLAEQLEILDARVFFDEYFEVNFLGKAWSSEFKRIFSDASRLVVCLLDAYHQAKIWPTFERECFEPRVAEASVIPIYLDRSVFVGIPKDIVGIKFTWDITDPKWKDKADEVVYKLVERLG